VTSMYVTHDQVEAMTLGQRIMVMNAGRAEQIGTPREIYDRPQTTFVAGFIGSPPMNLIAGRLNADGTQLRCDGGAIRLPAPVRALAERELLLGVRPEQLRAGGGQMQVGVEMAEALGADHLVHCSLGEQALVLRTAEDVAPAAGDSITLGFDAGAVHWFDPATTRRIDVG
jgi:sn-glycerol 3-phosphate transport system ATP-binding protein